MDNEQRIASLNEHRTEIEASMDDFIVQMAIAEQLGASWHKMGNQWALKVRGSEKVYAMFNFGTYKMTTFLGKIEDHRFESPDHVYEVFAQLGSKVGAAYRRSMEQPQW